MAIIRNLMSIIILFNYSCALTNKMPVPLDKPDIKSSPVGQPGNSYDILTLTINGHVYDTNNIPVNKAKIKVNIYNENSNIETETDEKGIYIIRGIYHNKNIEILVSKDGYRNISRNITTNALSNNISDSTFNFGGNDPEDKKYALERINNLK